jgi:23S rRNA pseudouridine2605 synthase
MTDAMPAGGSDGPCRERLHAFLARAGVASRRAGERLIGAGRVAVNGRHVTTQGNTVGPGDRVTLDGREVAVTAASVSVALHKPAGYLCSNHDPGNRPLARALLPAAAGRLFHVGRLDLASSGLILFTNNGQLAVRATHPRFGVEKEYEVFTDRGVPISVLEQYRAGCRIGDVTYRLSGYRLHPGNRVTLTLTEGRNREIRRVLGNAGLEVRRLTRVRVGPVTLRGLATGDWRPLTPPEVTWFLSRRQRAPNGTAAPAVAPPAHW